MVIIILEAEDHDEEEQVVCRKLVVKVFFATFTLSRCFSTRRHCRCLSTKSVKLFFYL